MPEQNSNISLLCRWVYYHRKRRDLDEVEAGNSFSYDSLLNFMKIYEMFRKLLASQRALHNDAVECGLLNDAVNILDSIASNYRMISE